MLNAEYIMTIEDFTDVTGLTYDDVIASINYHNHFLKSANPKVDLSDYWILEPSFIKESGEVCNDPIITDLGIELIKSEAGMLQEIFDDIEYGGL